MDRPRERTGEKRDLHNLADLRSFIARFPLALPAGFICFSPMERDNRSAEIHVQPRSQTYTKGTSRPWFRNPAVGPLDVYGIMLTHNTIKSLRTAQGLLGITHPREDGAIRRYQIPLSRSY
jgi:hypothetical protein